MELASLIISILALLIGGSSLVWQLAKHFSTHKIQMVPVDVATGQMAPSPATKQIGRKLGAEYRDFETGITDAERAELETRLKLKNKALIKPTK